MKTLALRSSWFLWIGHRFQLPLWQFCGQGQGGDYLLGRFGGIQRVLDHHNADEVAVVIVSDFVFGQFGIFPGETPSKGLVELPICFIESTFGGGNRRKPQVHYFLDSWGSRACRESTIPDLLRIETKGIDSL